MQRHVVFKERLIYCGTVCSYVAGPSVVVTVDVKDAQTGNTNSMDATASLLREGQTIADEFMDFAWSTRTYMSAKHLSVSEAVDLAQSYDAHLTAAANKAAASDSSSAVHASATALLPPAPLVMADVTDNPGSGHYGDATSLLAELVARNVANVVFYAIYDAEAALEAHAIGVGKFGELTFGGKFDPSAGGGPLKLMGKVVALTDGCFPSFGPMGGGVWQNFGLSALFRVGDNIDIVIISNNGQLLDISQITSMGVDPQYKRVIAVKSNHHFRAALAPIAGE
jgi:microcystin degradation protein MlrC